MGILKIDDVPPPLGAGGRDGDRSTGADGASGTAPGGFGHATAGTAGASTAAAASISAPAEGGAPGGADGGTPGVATPGNQPVIPPHVDGSAPPPQAPRPPLPAPDGRPASSMFDTSALTGPAGPAGQPSASSSEPPPPIEPDPVRTLELKPQIVEQLSTVFDPEIPVNIYELGLIYDIEVDRGGLAVIKMTLTAPGCPAAVTLPAEVQGKVKGIEGVSDARVDLVWEPPWDKDRMSDAAKLQLGIFD